jgi:predicted N-acetyltransferase YhbS
MSTAAPSSAAVTIRRAKPEDAPACGQICFDAFHKISTDHNFPPDVPAPQQAVGLLTRMFSNPGVYCVVAESDGRIAGSNCLDERDAIAGLGPITIDPQIQNRGIGRKLMQAVLERARERKFAGVRLVQAAFHSRSLSLYAGLGFDVREPLAVFQGPAINKSFEGFLVRPAKSSDLEACNKVALQVHGHHRGGELAEAIEQRSATVVERYGRITGYASSMAFYGHAVAETNPDLQAIVAAADGFGGPGILVPSRNSELFRWCLANGLRVVQPMTLMSLGLYNEPQGAFLPSILY